MSLHPKDAAVQAQAIWCIYVLCAKNWENRGASHCTSIMVKTVFDTDGPKLDRE